MITSDRVAINGANAHVKAIRKIMLARRGGRVSCAGGHDVLLNHLKDVKSTMSARSNPTTTKYWAALIRSSGIAELLVQMLLDATFFDESSDYIGLVLYPLSFLATRERLGSALDSILDATMPVWEHIWSHRRHLSHLASTEEGKQTLNRWAELLCAWAGLYSEERGDIPQECRLTHVGLHVWIIYIDCPREFNLLYAIRHLFKAQELPEMADSAQPFYVQCIEAPGGAGAGALASRLSCALKEGITMPHELQCDTIPLLGWLLFCVGDPYLSRSEFHGRPIHDVVFNEMVNLIADLAQNGVEFTEVLVHLHRLVVCYAQFYLDRIGKIGSPLMRDRTFVHSLYTWLDGHVLGTFLAQGLCILCQSLIFRVDEVNPELFAMELVLTWADWRIALKKLRKSCATSTFAVDVMSRITSALRADCIPYLARAQRFAQGNAVERAVGRFWELGRVIDLDVGNLMDEITEFNASHCSWRACPFYSVATPPASLKACKGCGDTRYCAKDCQRNDWVDGRHKLQCRRLK